MRLIDVYPYRTLEGANEFLILKRAPKKLYAGQWRMIGGKIKTGETAWKAALRELQEETSIKPECFWAIPSVNTFYHSKKDRIEQIPAFAARLPIDAKIKLNEEHTEFRWIQSSDAESLIQWPEQLRLMRLADTILNDQILDEWIISI